MPDSKPSDKDAKDTEAPPEERISYLEKELENTKKDLRRITENLFGTVAILCLPLNHTTRIEYGMKQLEPLPNNVLSQIIKTFVKEGKNSDMPFEQVISPIVSILGFERAWKILSKETIKNYYGNWAVHTWEEMAEKYPCEE